MKITPECVPCLLKRSLYEVNLIDSQWAEEAMKKALEILAEGYNGNACSAVLATEVHRKVYDILGVTDPYADEKERSNEVALSLLPKAVGHIDSFTDGYERFRAAVQVAVAGNVLDFGIGGSIESPEQLEGLFDGLLEEGLGHDDTRRLYEMLESEEVRKVLYFPDNCGEIVFDTLLLSELKKFNIHLTVIVKGEPILTDATMEDAKALSIHSLANEVITTGGYAVGFPMGDKMGQQLKEKLDTADLIISKGMANFECFSDTSYRPIAHLMRTKCNAVAGSLGLKMGISVVKVEE